MNGRRISRATPAAAPLSADDERSLQRLLDLVGEHVARLDDEVRGAARQGRYACADRAYDRATALRAALEAAAAVLATRFGIPARTLPLRPGEPSTL